MDLPWRKPQAKPASVLAGIDVAKFLADRERTLAHFAGQAAPITRYLPCPRAVALGGRVHVVAELRIRDLASLQAWLEDDSGHPLDGMPPAWADTDPETRPARLHAAWVAAASWPPRFGSPEASRRLGSPEGRAYFLRLVLARGGGRHDLAEVLALLPEITPAQWARLERIAWGVTPREEIAAEIAPESREPRVADWGKVFDQLLEHRGLGFEALGDLTLSQWAAVVTGGKPVERSEEFGRRKGRVRQFFARLGFGV